MNNLDHDQCEHGVLECVKKPSPPPFLLKTYMLVDDPTTNDTISWNSDGTAFVVWEPTEFSTHLLPTLFKHRNFSSFVRQLNTYGFRKVATNRWEFQNNMFRRGEPELLCNIRRRRPWESKLSLPGPMPMAAAEDDRGSSSTSSSSEHNSLLDENKRLKKENWVLTCELKSVKRKCKELLALVESVKRSAGIDVDEDCQYKSYKDERPKLFGVRLEVAEEEEKKKNNKRSTVLSESQSQSRQCC